MIELIKVTKSFDGLVVIKDLSLSIPEGETLVLLGPSGCGKSTLLRLMVGLLSPDRGQVRLMDENLTMNNMRALRQKIGFVLQDGGLFPHLTARQNVELMARYTGKDHTWIDQRISELAELAHLDLELLQRYPRQLSGGQAQRVALIRALMLDPDVLFLDEPLGALDPIHRAALQNDMKEIFNRLKKTVVLVTHDIGETAALADEVAIMDEGKIVQRGQLTTLVNDPVTPFVTSFIDAQRKPWQRLENLIS